ncbi:MAG: signal peptidase I [Rickettsiales bacterium]
MTEQQAEKKEKKHSWDDTLRTIIVAILLALSFRSLLYEPFHIPSGSMKSTLLVGDYLFVSKYSYGYSRYSFPLGLPIFEGRVMDSKPERGDIIVFRLPANPRIDYIKRLIGMPGDRVQVKDGIVFINGEPLKREQMDDYLDDRNKYNVRNIPRFEETLPEGKRYTILEDKENGPADNTTTFIVPEGHYFFMGDNRDNSIDSRFTNEVGFIPEENLVGKALMIFCSVHGGGSCFNPMNWFSDMRYERFFRSLD